MNKNVILILGILLTGTLSQAESLAQEAEASNMAFVKTVGHSHASVALTLNQQCQLSFESFNKKNNGKLAQDYFVDITKLEVLNQKDSYGEAVCFFSKIIEKQ